MVATHRILLLLGAVTSPVAGSVTPVAKVIQLLDDLKARVVFEGQTEATTYDKFACYCRSTTKSKSEAIISGRDTIQTLSAEIEDKTATKADKSAEVKSRQADHESLSKDLDQSLAECAKAKSEYDAKSADLNKAISSLNSAIQSLQSSKPASFLAVKQNLDLASIMNLVAESRQQEVSALLQMHTSVDPSDPVFKYHSQGIIDLLTKLLKEFRDEKTDVDEEWGKTDKSCTDTQGSLNFKITQNKEAMLALQRGVVRLAGEIAVARENLVNSEATLKDDQLYMKDLTSLCETRAQDWDQRSQMRADEIAALSGALEVLSADVEGRDTEVNKRAFIESSQHPVIGASIERNVAPHTHTINPSFLQEGVATTTSQAKVAKAFALLHSESERLHSSVLSSVAVHVESDPFGKVKNLIQKLIERLLSESTNEATKKGFCDKQLAKAKTDRDYRLADTKSLNKDIKSLELKQDELEAEIEMLTGDLKKLRGNLKEATETRDEERTENLKTIKTAKEGLTSVKQAITILKVFYNRAGKAAVLLQASPVDEDTSGAGFAGAYSGSQPASKNIIGLLEVIESDFDRTARFTEASEKKAEEEFVEFDRVSRADISAKDTKKTLDEEDLTTTKDTKKQTMEDLQKAQDLLDSALKTYEDLKPTCIDTGMSYEDRVAKREEEIGALKNALCILLPEDAEDKSACV